MKYCASCPRVSANPWAELVTPSVKNLNRENKNLSVCFTAWRSRKDSLPAPGLRPFFHPCNPRNLWMFLWTHGAGTGHSLNFAASSHGSSVVDCDPHLDSNPTTPLVRGNVFDYLRHGLAVVLFRILQLLADLSRSFSFPDHWHVAGGAIQGPRRHV